MTAADRTVPGALSPTVFETLRREIPTVEVCDKQIDDALHVLSNPEEYERRQWFDARRALKKWRHRRQAAEALAEVELYVQQTFPGLAHLADDAPTVRCPSCGRMSWANRRGDDCGMVQPDGTRCRGIFEEAS